MSKQNNVNPGQYHVAGRMTTDEAARERVKQRNLAPLADTDPHARAPQGKPSQAKAQAQAPQAKTPQATAPQTKAPQAKAAAKPAPKVRAAGRTPS